MVTIADVAGHAGVSSSTVSYALNSKRPVSAFSGPAQELGVTVRESSRPAVAKSLRSEDQS
ncbi:LacI family DNA-binding transcriptional regulator [Streptomyces cynarae]|uniref:LacI family DNA-binding transcriptional regulator n=1 Tax=Streptomyces cynarae TaxID=2981134 RepID=UPI0036F219DD